MVGIVFATHREAAPFLIDSAATRLADDPMTLFRPGKTAAINAIVAISGMGKVAAAMSAMHLVLKWKVAALINIGLCGWLGDPSACGVGDILRIHHAVEGDCDRFGAGEAALACDLGWFPELEAARLVTCDRPVFDADERQALSAIADLVDMEGAAIARVAALYQVPWTMIKGITDTAASSQDRSSLHANLSKVSEKIADVLWEKLRHI